MSLKPKKAQSTYQGDLLRGRPETYLVRQSVLINTQGDINAITFSDVKLNTKLTDTIPLDPAGGHSASSRPPSRQVTSRGSRGINACA